MGIASIIIRTTLDIDEPVLRELKSAQKLEGKSLGRLVSDLLAVALADRLRKKPAASECFQWVSKRMGARVDLSDRDAVYNLMDGGEE